MMANKAMSNLDGGGVIDQVPPLPRPCNQPQHHLPHSSISVHLPGIHHDWATGHTKAQVPSSSSSPDHQGHASSLSTFLHRDIDPQHGHRLLLPFLTTMDRLRLSECSQDLLNYRYHLTKVEVVNPHPSPTPSEKKGLAQLLYRQRGLEYLRVGDRSLLHVLDLASFHSFERLKTLDLSKEGMVDEEVLGYVARALEGGGLRGLEEISLNASTKKEEGFKAVLGCLKAGRCPQLRRLGLDGAFHHAIDAQHGIKVGCGHPLAQALESGHLRHLEELNLYKDFVGTAREGVAIARALQGGACPQLRQLKLWRYRLRPEDGLALGEAMRSGSCAKLEVLNLFGCIYLGVEGFTAIFGALEAGSCPSLQRLDLTETWLMVDSAIALGHALRSGNCHHLQQLELKSGFDDRDASLHVLRAIHQRGGGGGALLPNLHCLDMSGIDADMDEEHGRLLGEAIGGGTLPQLQELWISYKETLGDGGVVPIMAGLEGGGCRHLKSLEMRRVGMGPQGGLALARALASGHLSCLQDLDVSENGGIGDEGMVEVIKGLRECQPNLRKLTTAGSGMGDMAGRALIQALQDKVWPELEWLDAYSADETSHFGDDMVEFVVGMLDKWDENYPRLKVAYFGRLDLGCLRAMAFLLSQERTRLDSTLCDS